MVNPLSFSEFSQAQSLDHFGENFDLALGYVGPDLRSVSNLKDVASYAGCRWAYSCIDGADPKVEKSLKNKVDKNHREIPNFERKVWNREAEESLREFLISDRRNVSVFVDTSAFPRRVLASIFTLLRDSAASGVKTRVVLGYRLANYIPPSKGTLPPNKRVAPVHGDFAGWTDSPGHPVHLLVGLGYEMGKALGAVEYIQPSHWRLFVPDSPESRFERAVRQQNADLIAGTPEKDLYQYQVLDPAGQFMLLTSMLEAMVSTTKPVLLPFGPKIFFAICLLVSFNFPEVAIWHVSGEEQEGYAMTKPSNFSVYFGLSLQGM